MKVSKNLGTIDRVLRSGIALIMIYCIVFVIRDGVAATLLSLLLGINLYAIIMSNCPLYGLVGFSTCSRDGTAST